MNLVHVCISFLFLSILVSPVAGPRAAGQVPGPRAPGQVAGPRNHFRWRSMGRSPTAQGPRGLGGWVHIFYIDCGFLFSYGGLFWHMGDHSVPSVLIRIDVPSVLVRIDVPSRLIQIDGPTAHRPGPRAESPSALSLIHI